MQIFRFEWKRSQKYILIWAVALALCIFSMTPVYYGMVETAGTLPTGFAQGGFFETVGISLELLTKPMGMYSFLTGFFMIAGGIFGMHLGLSLHTTVLTYQGVHGKHSRIFVYQTLWTAGDIQRETIVRPCRGMCNRNFLCDGLLFYDDAVSPRISNRGIFSGGRLPCPSHSLFCIDGDNGGSIPAQ